jgi:hypothetical protein
VATSVGKKETISVKQFVTNKAGRKVAAILDISELHRVEELIEDLADIKSVRERKNEPAEDYEAYSRKRKSRAGV